MLKYVIIQKYIPTYFLFSNLCFQVPTYIILYYHLNASTISQQRIRFYIFIQSYLFLEVINSGAILCMQTHTNETRINREEKNQYFVCFITILCAMTKSCRKICLLARHNELLFDIILLYCKITAAHVKRKIIIINL